MREIEQWIPNLTGLLTVIVLLCSFILSFSNLRYAAEISLIDPVLTWAWPLCIDSLLVSGSLLVLRNSLRGESTRFGWLVLSVFTGVSIAFNVAVSPDTWISRAAHAIPPITLMVSFEILLSIVRSDLSPSIPVQEGEPDTRPVTPDVTSQQVLQFYRDNPSASYVTAASHLNITRHVSRLLENGKLFRDVERSWY
jgi:hypothetical protein